MATFEEIHRQNHTLALYCASCERWGDADLPALIRDGHAERRIAQTRFRCRDCGAIVDKQLRPPVPRVSAATAYI